MLELLVVVAIVALLSGLLLPAMAKARMRTQASTCLNNLKYLGTAGTMYEYDNGGKMPYAALRLHRGLEMTWDDLLDPYLGGRLTVPERWGGMYAGSKPMPYLRCPSDHVPTVTQLSPPLSAWRRSYAMPRYLFDRETSRWPPNVQSRTGVGLYWSFDDDGTPEPRTLPTWNTVDRPDADGTALHPYPRKQWSMRSNLILQPDETILLAERIHARNLRGDAEVAAIDHADQHCERGTVTLDDGRAHAYAPASVYHNSAFDYLMVDGHADLIEPQATVKPGNTLKSQSGMWTIFAGD